MRPLQGEPFKKTIGGNKGLQKPILRTLSFQADDNFLFSFK